MTSKATTFILKFYRNKSLLDIEIHPDWDMAASQAVAYAACFMSSRRATEFENLVQSWDTELGPLVYGDDEYTIWMDSQEARFAPRENNLCMIIPFRRQTA